MAVFSSLSKLVFALRLAALAAGAVTLANCAKPFTPLQHTPAANQDSTTGGTSANGTPYTGLGQRERLENLKRLIPDNAANRALTRQLRPALPRRLGSDGDVVTTQPSALSVSVQIGATTLQFHAVLDRSGSQPRAVGVRSQGNTDARWTLAITCADTDCLATEMRLKRDQVEAGWITAQRPVYVQVLGPYSSQTPSAAFRSMIEELGRPGTTTLETVEIAWGSAHFQLNAGRACISGDALATGDQPAPAQVACGISGVRAALSGNSTHGDLLIRIEDDSTWAFVRVQSSPSTEPTAAPAPVTPPVAPGASTLEAGNTLFPVNLAHPITAAFEADRERQPVQERIEHWKRMPRMTSFLRRVRPNLSTMIEALTAARLPSEMLFVTFVESNYFVDDGYPVAVSPVLAVGPWQFMPGTARDYGLRIRPLIETRRATPARRAAHRADPCDQRGDLALSSRAGARHLRRLVNLFPADPKLALMSYNWGEGRVQNLQRCHGQTSCISGRLASRSMQNRLSEIQRAGFDYWMVREFNLAPRESLEYVVNFLAAQFVGRNPERYGLVMPTEEYPAATPPVCPN